MNTNTPNTIETNTQPAHSGSVFLPYLKKWLREMPLGVCREMIDVHVFRLQHRIAMMEQITDARQDELEGIKAVVAAMCDFQKIINDNITEYGEAAQVDANPEFDEDVAAEVFLRAIGW